MKNIDRIVNLLCDKWQLTNLVPLTPSEFTGNYIAQAFSLKTNSNVFLKILVTPTNEIAALKLFSGNNFVKLLDYDEEFNAILLEDVYPGTALKTLFPVEENKSIDICIDLIKKIHKNKLDFETKRFSNVFELLDLLNTFESKIIPDDILIKAKKTVTSLIDLKQDLYLLHGDIHHENILKRGNEWILIDPQGIVGPLEYEVARFIINPIPDLLNYDAKTIIKNRIDKFSKAFNFKQHILEQWVFVQAVLSTCWMEEDGNKDLANYFYILAQKCLSK